MDRATSIDGGVSTREFYLPATYGFSRSPSRLERFFARHLRSHDVGARLPATEARRDFYLPGTPR